MNRASGDLTDDNKKSNIHVIRVLEGKVTRAGIGTA